MLVYRTLCALPSFDTKRRMGSYHERLRTPCLWVGDEVLTIWVSRRIGVLCKTFIVSAISCNIWGQFLQKIFPRFSNQIWVLPSTMFFHLITVTEAHWLEEFKISVPSPFKTTTPIRNSCVYTGILTGGVHVLFLPIPGGNDNDQIWQICFRWVVQWFKQPPRAQIKTFVVKKGASKGLVPTRRPLSFIIRLFLAIRHDHTNTLEYLQNMELD